MSLTEKVLETKQAREAIGQGIITLLKTGNLDQGIDAMIKTGEKNGSYQATKLAFLLDIFGISKL